MVQGISMPSTYTVLLAAVALELFCLFMRPRHEIRMFSAALSLYAVYLTLDTTNMASPANMPGLAAGLAIALHSLAGVKLPVPDMFVSGMLLGVLAQQASIRSGMMSQELAAAVRAGADEEWKERDAYH